MQRGPLSPSPSDGPGALGTTYPGVHCGQGTAGLRVPAFNAGLRAITPSRAETKPPETTSSGMHREPLSSTPIAHCESQRRGPTSPGMPCAPRAQRPEAVGVLGAPPRVPPGPHAAGAWGLRYSLPPTSPSMRKRRGRKVTCAYSTWGLEQHPHPTDIPAAKYKQDEKDHGSSRANSGPGAEERPPEEAPGHAQVLGPRRGSRHHFTGGGSAHGDFGKKKIPGKT
nr:uncharacterized protein LOC129051647 isoform X2 [Pongo abelii]